MFFQKIKITVNKTAPDTDTDDIKEESSCSESHEAGPGSSPEGDGVQEEKEMIDRIIKTEESNVRDARLLINTAITAIAMAVSYAVYMFAFKSDRDTFALEYKGYVGDIISLVQWEVQYNFALMQQLSGAVTSAAIMTGSVFPNVTLPHFEVTGGYVDGMGGIMAAAFAPLVKHEERSEWEEYSVLNQGWLAESVRLHTIDAGQRDALHGTFQDSDDEHDRRLQSPEQPVTPLISPRIYDWKNGIEVEELSSPGQILAPLWQVSPASALVVNENLFSNEILFELYETMIATDQPVMSTAIYIGDLFDFLFDEDEKEKKRNPHAYLMEPVYSAFEEDPELVGFITGVTAFSDLLDKILPEDAIGIVCVIKDSCGGAITYELNGRKSTYLGAGDLHDTRFDTYERSFPMELYTTTFERHCAHDIYIYPSVTFRELYNTKYPAVYTSVVALAFFVTNVLLFIYDRLVTRRQNKTMDSVIRTSRFVSTLFPANVLADVMGANDNEQAGGDDNDKTGVGLYKSRPIADYFPHTTVMFADISGFTAWSSAREPFQVFQLLETLYGAFDAIAERRRVFKVETVGDCYVAVCGLPLPRKDHAVVMARFASDCTREANKITRRLEAILGPETADLAFRIGLHSGPVTGGVLRGKNARFQLFGDTMNTASRMESTGARDRVQVSTTTAELLIAAGKSHWVTPRADTVTVKGKGQLKTFWLTMHSDRTASESSGSINESDSTDHDEDLSDSTGLHGEGDLTSKDRRLIDWNVAALLDNLKAVVKHRNSVQSEEASSNSIEPAVVAQLKCYVTGIATMYRDNPFHNFEHASHVTMSVTKLLSRVVTSDDATEKRPGSDQEQVGGGRFTDTIAWDGLTHLAAVFSALIHDVDHTGLPNARLVAEQAPVAIMYGSKSVAEKNSITIAWEFLMRPEFSELRACIGELERFHHLVIDAVMATDIADKELKEERNARWETLFAHEAGEAMQLKATIVLDHLMQAADVSHTMQHWHIYRKWNERLFHEMWKAYKAGRADTNPVDTWYKSELGFFDFYVIPLAEKLSACGVFGVSSKENLQYALGNRREWELEGEGVVAVMVDKYCRDVPGEEN